MVESESAPRKLDGNNLKGNGGFYGLNVVVQNPKFSPVLPISFGSFVIGINEAVYSSEVVESILELRAE
jgi:hypothetical protein